MTNSFQFLNEPDPESVRQILAATQVEPDGIEIMTPKMVQFLIKIKKLKPAPANIIKQQALSVGGEAAMAYGVINNSVDFTDVILAATRTQLKNILEKLKLQAFGLKELAVEIEKDLNNFENFPPVLEIGGRIFNLKEKLLIMGVLNLTPDSFYNGSRYTLPESAVKKAEEMLKAGADLLDIGGESSRPGSEAVSEDEEIKRVVPVVEKIYREFSPLISIDTTKSAVAKAALDAGAVLVNDISALRFDSKMAATVAAAGVPVILMHMQGSPKNMQENPEYEDVVIEIIDFFKERINRARESGIPEEKIIIDPGIGFGKTLEHNLQIINYLFSFKVLGRPILCGHSRKSFIGKILDLPQPADRLEGSSAVAAAAVKAGANILRVHDVPETARVVRTIQALMKGR